MSSVAGWLSIEIDHRNGRIERVRSRLQRPLAQLCERLAGQPPEQALALIGMLFSLCGRAHGVAGARALEQARGQAPDCTIEQWRERLIRVERIRETGLHLLRDWQYPGATESRLQTLLKISQQLLTLLERGAQGQEAELACAAQALQLWWQDMKLPDAARADWIARRSHRWRGLLLGRAVPALNPGQDQSLHRALETAFSGAALGTFGCRQTGPVTAASELRDGAEVMAAVLNRLLVQLAYDLEQLNADFGVEDKEWQQGQARSGCGWARTARGWLLHQIQLEGERVRQWRILAPTDWNFHTEGALRQRLEGVAVERERVEDLVRDLVLLHDPCLGYETRINHA